MSKQFVVIEDAKYNDVFCKGIFASLREAVGCAYLCISKASEDYANKGDTFNVHPPRFSKCTNMWFVELECKRKDWDEYFREIYYILEVPEIEQQE